MIVPAAGLESRAVYAIREMGADLVTRWEVILAVSTTVLGVVLGAHYAGWLQGPTEGVFSLQLNEPTTQGVDEKILEQVEEFPVTLRLVHIDGPGVDGVTVVVRSAHPIAAVTKIRDDEQAAIALEDGDRELVLDLEHLRKGSRVEYGFSSLGVPDLNTTVRHRNGRNAEAAPPSRPWFENEWFLLLLLGLVTLGAVGFAAKTISRFIGGSAVPRGALGVGLGVAVLSIVNSGLADAALGVMLAVVLERVARTG